MAKTLIILVTTLWMLALAGPAGAEGPRVERLTLERVATAPADGRKGATDAELVALRAAVDKAPGERAHRFALVRALLGSARLEQARVEARAWRAIDAYNLVVVRLIGDILTELGRAEDARRAYSAVVELLPKDPSAHRALATVLKQGGDLAGAHARLRSATTLRPDDLRIRFELADVAQRLDRVEEARALFEGIIASEDAPAQIAYPARQRLAQLYAWQRRRALQRSDADTAGRLAAAIAALKVKGGIRNDIKVYLSWDTDRTDVDLWVINPAGQKVFYNRRRGRFGGSLYDDVTNGYGPESFTAPKGAPGTYQIKVHYYGTARRAFTEARGEVIVVLNEGTAHERRHVLPYRLFQPKQKVTVARIRVQE